MAELTIERGTIRPRDFRLVRKKPFAVSASRNIRVPIVAHADIGDAYHIYQDTKGNLLLLKDADDERD